MAYSSGMNGEHAYMAMNGQGIFNPYAQDEYVYDDSVYAAAAAEEILRLQKENATLRTQNKKLDHKLFFTEKELKGTEAANREQQDRIKDLSFQLLEERKQNRANNNRNIAGLSDPFTGNANVGNFRYGSVSPIAVRNGRIPSQLSPSAAPYTPTTQRTPRGPPMMDTNTGASTGRRHKRTETPEQLFLRPFTNGIPIFTFGIAPQNDRGLLHDFFDGIRQWAASYTKDLSPDEIAEYAKLAAVVEMIGPKSDIEAMLAEKKMRIDIVTGLVARDIVHHAVSEDFLSNSKHYGGEACHELLSDFAGLGEGAYAAKHEMCQEQEALYTKLKSEHGHKDWRDVQATAHCRSLISKLSCLLAPRVVEPGAHDDREHNLVETYVKGYRIGFRLRMEAVKWQVIWPAGGSDLNLSRMCNQSREMYGDPMTTLMRLEDDPENFFVRFAVTPSITKSDFSTGKEKKAVAHSALVYIGHRGIYCHHDDYEK